MFSISLGPYVLVCSLICIFFLFMAYLNGSFLRNMTLSAGASTFPMVSVLIPARNEEHNIRNCLNSLLAQHYPNYEILVIDDNSSDRTGEIIEEYAVQHRNIRAYRGSELPEGWNGKPFACQQLAEHARGEYLLFTDADTVHSPQSISWAVNNALGHRVDCLSAYPKHEIRSLGESMIVPVIYLMTAFFMPLWLIPRRNSKIFSFAIGQFILCRADAFWGVDGFNGIAGSLVEDMALVKRMKAFGFRTIFLDAKNHIRCRMYVGFKGSVRGIVKSVYAALNHGGGRDVVSDFVCRGTPSHQSRVSGTFQGARTLLIDTRHDLFYKLVQDIVRSGNWNPHGLPLSDHFLQSALVIPGLSRKDRVRQRHSVERKARQVLPTGARVGTGYARCSVC
jgi:chlorobactene glucosyltransferase